MVLIYRTPGKWIDDGGRVIISTQVVKVRTRPCVEHNMLALPMSASNCTSGGLLRSHIDRTIDKSDHQVYRLSEFYPYAILKPKEINCDRDTWLKDPMSRLLTETVQRTGSRHFYKTTCIIKQTERTSIDCILPLVGYYGHYRPDYRQERSSKWPCQYTILHNSTRTLN